MPPAFNLSQDQTLQFYFVEQDLRLERFEDLAWQLGRIPAGLIDVKPSMSTGGESCRKALGHPHLTTQAPSNEVLFEMTFRRHKDVQGHRAVNDDQWVSYHDAPCEARRDSHILAAISSIHLSKNGDVKRPSRQGQAPYSLSRVL